MIQNIFISYRRSDSQDIAGRIYDRLTAQFGKSRVFKDVDSIPIGVDFRKHLSEIVGSCEVLLAVVGERWLDAKDDSGKRRLDSGGDLVRIEIEAALARGIPVVPVLVGKATMPHESDLPPSVAPLVYRQAVPVRPDPDFHRDMDRLNAALRSILETRSQPQKQKDDVVPNGHQEPDLNQTIEAPVENPQAVRRALDGLEAAHINAEVLNLIPVARKLHEASKGGEVLPLCAILSDGKATLIDQYKAVKLLAVVLRWPEAKPFLGTALDALLEGGALRGNLQTAALEAFMVVPLSPKEKWERLFDALSLASNSLLTGIINSIAQVTPPQQRARTCQQLADRLQTAGDWTLIWTICNVLKQFGDRSVVPQLIQTLEASLPQMANAISDILVGWRIIDAATAIRAAIENGRFGTDINVAPMAKNLYLLEGSVCNGFLAEVLRDAVPALQLQILQQLPSINEAMFIDVVADLAANSLDSNVKNQAGEFIKKTKTS